MIGLAIDIWASFRRLPGWVQLWIVVILVPVNAASVFFLAEPGGGMFAALAIGGMVPNVFIVLFERGFSKLMSLPHVLIWSPLVVYAAGFLADTALVFGSWRIYLGVLLVVNMINLAFDYVDH